MEYSHYVDIKNIRVCEALSTVAKKFTKIIKFQDFSKESELTIVTCLEFCRDTFTTTVTNGYALKNDDHTKAWILGHISPEVYVLLAKIMSAAELGVICRRMQSKHGIDILAVKVTRSSI